MKKYFYSILLFLIIKSQSFASNDGGVTGISGERLRKGEVNIHDIPTALVSATQFFIGIAGAISVIFIIIGAYKYLFGSIEGNTDKGKDTIFMALVGFAISACAYIIMKFVIDNFAG